RMSAASRRPATVGFGPSGQAAGPSTVSQGTAPPLQQHPLPWPSTPSSQQSFSAVAEECADHFHCLVCGLVAVVQCALLNYYLVTGLSVAWLWFLVADIVVIGALVYGFVNTYLYRRGQYTRFLEAKQPGEIPFAWALWLLNQACVVARLIVIYYSFGTTVGAWGNVGSNLLRTTGALSCVTGFLLMKSLLLGPPFILKNHLFIFRIGAETAIDVLDAVDFLDVLLVNNSRQRLPAGLTECILTFAAATLLAPACLMSVYSFSRFGYLTTAKSRLVRSLHLLFSVLLCNLPLFIIRLYLWYSLSLTLVSAFVVKNILFIYLNFTDLMRQILPEMAGQSALPGTAAAAAASVGASRSQQQADVGSLEQPLESLSGSRAGLITSP
ncbi:hypothetical protein BOX15_Mlig031672g1, partial [Macrostomum lignano]